jgi:ParB-like chromosome segregation protein Spo0J
MKPGPMHPLADLFPPLTPAEYAALRDSIRVNGQREPITLHRDGRTIDGLHRAQVCAELGTQPKTETFPGSDADILEFALDRNLRRRHLNESQQALILTKEATLRKGRPAKNTAQAAFTQADLAAKFGISTDTLQRARLVLNNAEPEIIAAVYAGSMTVKTAAAIAKKPREQQIGRLQRDQRKADGSYRQEEDFYRTPEETIRALLSVEKFYEKVWECACGDGAISRVLIDHGYAVISTDLYDRDYGKGGVDFLATTKLLAGDVVTNPPYDDDMPEKFAVHALELGARKVALLCRLTWLEGVERHKRLFRLQQLARVRVFSARQTLWRGDDDAAEDDGGMTAYAWFVFEQDHCGSWTGSWLVPEKETGAGRTPAQLIRSQGDDA